MGAFPSLTGCEGKCFVFCSTEIYLGKLVILFSRVYYLPITSLSCLINDLFTFSAPFQLNSCVEMYFGFISAIDDSLPTLSKAAP